MRDEDKTKEQLITELRTLRKENAELRRIHLEDNSRLRIGEILVEMGYLTGLQLERSLKDQESEMISQMVEGKRRKIGEILRESGIITEEQLSSALEEQRVRIGRWEEMLQSGKKQHRWQRWFRKKRWMGEEQ